MPPPLGPIELSNQTVATSGVQGQTGFDLINPVTNISFGGGSSNNPGVPTLASNIIAGFTAQAKQITSKGTFLGDLGIGPDTLATIAVTVGVALVVISLR
jgi:hypothetical protein